MNYGLRQYSIPPSTWPAVEYTPLIGLPPVVVPAMVCQLGAESDPIAYIGHLVHVFRLARPALRRDGTLWVNLGDSYAGSWGNYGGRNRGNGSQRPIVNGSQIDNRAYDTTADIRPSTSIVPGIPDKNMLGIPARAALALQADGWVWRNDIIWHAPNKMPESVRDRFTRAHEDVLLFGNSARYYFDSDAVAEETTDPEYRERGKVRPTADPLWADSTNGNNRGGLHNQVGGRLTRNRRDVWSIATTPMPQHLRTADEAHYAAWPPALVEVMVKAASANKACGACGAAYTRITERSRATYERVNDPTLETGRAGWNRPRPGPSDRYVLAIPQPELARRLREAATNGRADAMRERFGSKWDHWTRTDSSGARVPTFEDAIEIKALLGIEIPFDGTPGGFAPACTCGAPVGRCVILDPFAGTGTTLQVAESLGRDSIGIDLGYQTLQERRTNGIQVTMDALL